MKLGIKYRRINNKPPSNILSPSNAIVNNSTPSPGKQIKPKVIEYINNVNNKKKSVGKTPKKDVNCKLFTFIIDL